MIADMVQIGREKKEPYKRLAEINRAITTSLDFDKVLNLIVENAAHLVDAEVCLLLLTDGEQRFRIRASRGIEKSLIDTFSGRIEEDVIDSLSRILGLNPKEQLVSVPVIAKHSLNGLLIVAREEPLEPEEEWQLAALADQAAIALRNARLYEMELAEATRERDQTMEALRESNARVTRILESITDLFYQLDREWRFTDANSQTERRFGKSRKELLGKNFWDVFPEARNTHLFKMFHEAIEQMRPQHFEVSSVIAPGTWFEAHAYPNRHGLSVYLRDITERKAAEVTSHLLASIVESSDDAVISKDLNGVISSWNKAAERIFGYSADEVIGHPIAILIPPDRLDEEPVILRRIRAGRSVQHYETIRRRKDGKLIDISLTVSPLRDEYGTIVGASKIARDITAHKKALQSIKFQASLLDAVEQAVIATDVRGTVIYWNSFAESLYGWPAHEAIGRNIMGLTPSVNAQEQAKKVLAKLSAGESWSGELKVKRRDGSEFPAMVTDSPITNDKNELIGIVGVSVDITAEKLAEAERTKLLDREKLAREEAEKANRLKDEFLATLSHELRNPLNVVIGYSEILRRSSHNANQQFVHTAAEVIRRNALAQSQLVSDLLDLSRLQMHKLTINRQPVMLSTIIADAIETVKDEAEAKTISLEVENHEQLLVVNGDPVRLGQIAWNLLNNAVKFTPAGGKITLALSEDGPNARIDIKDTGQGIPPDFLPHVFEIFRQADSSSARKQGGLGIGLALVKQLVGLHGGFITAKSKGPGQGAEFSVWLPTQSSNELQESATSLGTAPLLDHKQILVVDDSRETTDMLSRLLEMEGADVKTARSGFEAIEVAANASFDLIISDISMPGMDGYELLHRLRSMPLLKKVPALALTGFGSKCDISRAHDEGFAQHFTKPLDIDKLLETIKALTSQPKLQNS
ncbi:MAG TPA: PAS domain S-box protein [Pyrinomonadaceae bacterium]|nr:PAS domain S-box protein [Pyrinomonadaceae bacterium]